MIWFVTLLLGTVAAVCGVLAVVGVVHDIKREQVGAAIAAFLTTVAWVCVTALVLVWSRP